MPQKSRYPHTSWVGVVLHCNVCKFQVSLRNCLSLSKYDFVIYFALDLKQIVRKAKCAEWGYLQISGTTGYFQRQGSN